MTQRNNSERAKMLLERRTRQELREFGHWYNGKFYTATRPALVPAWMNRRTGKPHENRREIARRLTHMAVQRINATGRIGGQSYAGQSGSREHA
jgi:hypothetical protein